jgi:methionyl-tRNA synthetase
MRFYVTTAIDYVNSRPHLGQAYEKVSADVIARYQRLRGVETHFVMGNDEHSQNVFKKAREAGLDPLAYCAEMEEVFRARWRELNVSFDDFIRTTEPRHRAGVQQLAQRSYDNGDIYEGTYEGWYCVSCEAFRQEKDLVDGKCPFHPTLTPEWIKEKNYFFRLSKYRDRLLAHFAAHPEFLQPDVRRNEILRLLESGLEDISMSRAGQAWGIPLPFAPSNVVYVWFDALINYISAVGYGTDPAMFAHWWPATLHIIGKDITRFHTVVWPAMLWSAGLEPPRQVFGHGWINYGGQRMSKTLGTSVDPADLVARRGADPARLYLTKEITYGADGDFTWERFEERYNVDLANNLGNLVSRVSTMVERYRDGTVGASAAGPGPLVATAAACVREYREAMDRFALHEATGAAFRLIGATNEFIAESEPWSIARGDPQSDRLTQVLFDASEAIRIAGVLLLPVMPAGAAEILQRAGEPVEAGRVRLEPDAAWKGSLVRTLVRAPSLWPRLDRDDQPRPIEARQTRELVVTQGTEPPIQPPAATPASPAAAPGTASQPGPAQPPPVLPGGSRMSIDDFLRIDLRVARVLSAERVPKSRKLLKLHVDLGSEQRTLVAGLAEAYEPEALVGRTVVVVANLEPATLMGIESNGMVLAASPEGGRPELLSFAAPPPPGSRVR